MVTMPGSASADDEFISELIDAGMDIARINCAHARRVPPRPHECVLRHILGGGAIPNDGERQPIDAALEPADEHQRSIWE